MKKCKGGQQYIPAFFVKNPKLRNTLKLSNSSASCISLGVAGVADKRLGAISCFVTEGLVHLTDLSDLTLDFRCCEELELDLYKLAKNTTTLEALAKLWLRFDNCRKVTAMDGKTNFYPLDALRKAVEKHERSI